ncbi:hypothetical protein BJ546DRAFT_1068065 [Cryomyces antarcticus]
MSPSPYAYIISRNLDPVFALFIGLSAAAARINREEQAKGMTMQQTIDTGRRRLGLVFGSVSKEEPPRVIGRRKDEKS